MNKLLLAVASIGLVLCTSDGLAQSAERGSEPYKVCAGCHGSNGEGLRPVAPYLRIAPRHLPVMLRARPGPRAVN